VISVISRKVSVFDYWSRSLSTLKSNIDFQ
jgi:hypothetical protein